MSECPFLHPRTCPKLLNNGSKGKYGCDGAKCGKFHPKMCSNSLNFNRCPPDCRQGYHVRTNSRAVQEKRKEEETKRKKEQEQKKRMEEERARTRMQLLQQSRARRDTVEPPKMPDVSVPPPSMTRTLSEEEKQAAFLGEVRKEILKVLLTVFPGAQSMVSAPGPAPALAPPGPGLGLNWAEALKLNMQ